MDMVGEIMRAFVVSSLLLLTTACGAAVVSPYARATAGRIGCPASDIELDGIERDHRGPESWVAFCGRTGFVCSSSGALANPRVRIVCSELASRGTESARRQ
jgi:hypothetical protein